VRGDPIGTSARDALSSRPESPGALSVRRPASFVFWFLAVILVAAATQAGRDLLSWRTWTSAWTSSWTSTWKPPWSRSVPVGMPLSGRARAVDGDSLDIAGERVRLLGIDAPELHQTCADAAGDDYPCGRDAARALADLVRGKPVTCTPLDHDRYDRDVVRCTADGRDLGDAMVRSGHAVELARFSSGAYTAAEREARAARRGLWAGRFEEPAAWRRRHPH
jgi:endonuclease YncB( thermonuclease family)